MFAFQKTRVPDILECIANLSSDVVFTPPVVSKQILDALPPSVWRDSSLRFLDPAVKSGVFMREIAKRLMEGLASEFPDENKRKKHIFKNMVFGIAVSELTAQMARRTTYYSKDATNKNSVIQFDDSEGNVSFERLDHTYEKGQCKHCGSPEGMLDRGEALETYAYPFIHKEITEDMKFDVIVGNPPYHLEDLGAGASASPIYQLFVDQAIRLKPRYISMVIPSRWFAGGKGLAQFRDDMLKSRHFRKIVDYPNAKEIFPSQSIKGGVCYFLWDTHYDGPCEVVTVRDGVFGKPVARYLDEHGDIFVRFNESISLLERVLAKSKSFMDEQISPRKPFGFPTNFNEFKDEPFSKSVTIYTNGSRVGYIARKEVTTNPEWIDKWKVLTPYSSPGNDDFPHMILGEVFVAKPGTCCTETYLVAGSFDTKEEAESLASYLRTRFARFMVSLRRSSQHVTQTRFKFVPQVPFDRIWTDKELYKRYGITSEEAAFIETIVRPMGIKEGVDER